MADIQKLTEEILKDAKLKADQTLADAQALAQQKIEAAMRDSESRKEQILKRAEQEARLAAERIVSGANLRLRDDKLTAKGQVIDKVLDQVREGVRGMTEEDELNYVLKELRGRVLRPDEKLIVRSGLAKKVQAALGGAQVEEKDGVSGYVIDRRGVIENHSFETTLDYLKEDLEAQASQILFPN